MKKFLILLCVILIIAFFSINCFAETPDEPSINSIRSAVSTSLSRDDADYWKYFMLTYEQQIGKYVFYASKVAPIIDMGGDLYIEGRYLYSYFDINSKSFNEFIYSAHGIVLDQSSYKYGTVDITDIQSDEIYFTAAHPEYFKPLEPLYATIGGVSSSTLSNNTIPFIRGVFSVLVPVGVAILATFCVIKLIGRRSLINR